MTTVELEAQKAHLAREILCMNDEYLVNNLWLMFKNSKPFISQQKRSQKREIGFLDGKAKIEFMDDFEMTTEELLSMQ